MIEVKILDTPLGLDYCMSLVEDDTVGGIVNFVGTVRNYSKGETIVALEFEAYEKMAIQEMNKIAILALEKFDIKHMIIHHRVGKLDIGEIPVIIVTAAVHRKAAFEACEFAIDELKKTVPIWKKEFLKNGSYWVAAHP